MSLGAWAQRLRRSLLTERARIQVCRVRHSSFVFPWALLYDIPLESGADYSFCKSATLPDCWTPRHEDFPTCPYEDSHTGNTICPYGFWGIKHSIENPPSMPEGEALPRAIPIRLKPRMIFACNPDLDERLSTAHMEGLAACLSSFTISQYTKRQELSTVLAEP